MAAHPLCPHSAHSAMETWLFTVCVAVSLITTHRRCFHRFNGPLKTLPALSALTPHNTLLYCLYIPMFRLCSLCM